MMSYSLAARVAFIAMLAHFFSFNVAYSANRTWTAGVNGDFGDPARWTGGVPGAADTATFSVGSGYQVTFDNSPNPLANPVQNQGFTVSAGTVTFASGTDGIYTYQLTG